GGSCRLRRQGPRVARRALAAVGRARVGGRRNASRGVPGLRDRGGGRGGQECEESPLHGFLLGGLTPCSAAAVCWRITVVIRTLWTNPGPRAPLALAIARPSDGEDREAGRAGSARREPPFDSSPSPG